MSRKRQFDEINGEIVDENINVDGPSIKKQKIEEEQSCDGVREEYPPKKKSKLESEGKELSESFDALDNATDDDESNDNESDEDDEEKQAYADVKKIMARYAAATIVGTCQNEGCRDVLTKPKPFIDIHKRKKGICWSCSVKPRQAICPRCDTVVITTQNKMLRGKKMCWECMIDVLNNGKDWDWVCIFI